MLASNLPSETELIPHRREVAAVLLLVAGAIFVVLRWWLPLDESILSHYRLQADSVRAGLAVLGAASFLWLTEALPVSATALLIPLLGVLASGRPVEQMLAPFADPIIFLFFGGFVIAGALSLQGLDRWVAQSVIQAAGGRFTLASLLLIVVTAVLSSWISNTATAAMMLPLGIGLAHHLQAPVELRRRAELFLLLGIAYAASVGGVGTVLGTPPNAITAEALKLDFPGWLKFGLPTFLLWLPALLGVLLLRYRPSWSWQVRRSAESWTWTRPRLLTLAIFLAAACCWFASRPLGQWLRITKGFDTIVALMAAVSLCLLRLISWKDVERSVEWGVLLLFGGGMVLGRILEDTGTSSYLARVFVSSTQGWPLPVLLLTLAATVTLLSEFASNTAVATLMVPLFVKVAAEMGLPAEKLVIPVGLAASCGFMLPVATPPNAIVYATGRVRQREMIIAGMWLDVICVILVTLLGWLVF